MPRATAPASDDARLDGRTVVVTGGTVGLGYFACEQLAELGATVVIAARNPARGEAAMLSIAARVPGADIRFERLDLGDLASVRAAGASIAALPRVDALLANAGAVWLPEWTRKPAERGAGPVSTADGHELYWGTNFLGHFALTALLLPSLLAARGRVVQLGSLSHSGAREPADSVPAPQGPQSGFRRYARSKLAVMSFGLELARRFEARGEGAASLLAHPGTAMDALSPARPGIGSNQPEPPALLRPLLATFGHGKQDGARPLVTAVASERAANGDYWGPGGRWGLRGSPARQRPHRAASDRETGERLVSVAEDLTGIRLGV